MDFSGIAPSQFALSVALAALPVLIWMKILFGKDRATRKQLLKIFLFGVFSVVPLVAIQYVWVLHPEFDVYSILQTSFEKAHVGFLALFIAVGIFEEVAKFSMLRHLRWLGVKIQSINDAMRYIFVIALGFAFTENIFYFYSLASSQQFSDLFAAFAFRSTYTTAGHMVFSGIVGYYYAIGKFGNPVLELHRWTGQRHPFMEWCQKNLHLKSYNIFHLEQTFKGLGIAMVLHAAFNFALQFNRMDYAAGIVVVGFAMVIYLSKKRSTYLVFTDKERARPSTIGKAEENVVIELMGMWMNEGKYAEVIEICDRLAVRDPDNNVVKLFRAKAIDRRKIERVSRAIRLLFSEEDYDAEKEELSLFQRLKRNQERRAIARGHYAEASVSTIREALKKHATDETFKAVGDKKTWEELHAVHKVDSAPRQ